MSGGNYTTAEAWCDALNHPCLLFPDAPGLAVVSQPSSTYICVALAMLYFLFAGMLLQESRYGQQEITPRTRPPLGKRLGASFAPVSSWCSCGASRHHPVPFRQAHRSRLCYAASVFGFGVAVSLACASYQTFTWQLNCRGIDRPCVGPEGEPLYSPDTNPVAVGYLILQVASYHLMVVGDAYRALRRYVNAVALYSLFATALFAAWCLAVRIHGFEDLFAASLVVSAPPVLGSIALNGLVRYEWRLVVAWGVLLASYLGYVLHGALLDESRVWQDTDVWFHANDTLHVMLFPYPVSLWWAGGLAEDAPKGTVAITDDQAEGDAELPSLLPQAKARADAGLSPRNNPSAAAKMNRTDNDDDGDHDNGNNGPMHMMIPGRSNDNVYWQIITAPSAWPDENPLVPV